MPLKDGPPQDPTIEYDEPFVEKGPGPESEADGPDNPPVVRTSLFGRAVRRALSVLDPLVETRTDVMEGVKKQEAEPDTPKMIDISKIPIDDLPGLSGDKKAMLKVLYPRGFSYHTKQGRNTGDCYLASPLAAVRRNPIIPYVVTDLVGEDFDEKQGSVWTINFKRKSGSERYNPTVMVGKHEDITDGQVIRHRNGKKSFQHAIQGSFGDILLERAFGRLRKFNDFGISPSGPRDNDDGMMTQMHTMVHVAGGNARDPLEALLGDLGQPVNVGNCGRKPLLKQGLYADRAIDLLKKVAKDPVRYIMTASTPQPHETPYSRRVPDREFGDRILYFMDPEERFYQKHSYAVFGVDLENETVTIANPHDTEKYTYEITFEEFLNYFDNIDGYELDMEVVRDRFGDIMNRADDKTYEPIAERSFPGDHDACLPAAPNAWRYDAEKVDMQLGLDPSFKFLTMYMSRGELQIGARNAAYSLKPGDDVTLGQNELSKSAPDKPVAFKHLFIRYGNDGQVYIKSLAGDNGVYVFPAR